MTSAPRSASSFVQYGPAIPCDRSTTRMPVSACSGTRRMIAGSLRGVRFHGDRMQAKRPARTARHAASRTTPSTARFHSWGCILFGNFVFFGLRCTSGMRQQREADLYLNGEGGRWRLTDYNCGFVRKNGKLCSALFIYLTRCHICANL